MWIADVCFSYEWLLHIGASTKTMDPDNHAGYFGEGFKMASLCALRDYGWHIRMASGSWALSVITIRQTIDQTDVQMLAYDVEDVEKEQKGNCLTLSYITQEEYQLFQYVLQAFYYPENPLIGEKIWEGEAGAVYARSSAVYDNRLPHTGGFGKKGAVFCGYQLLGSNPFPLVVCLHQWERDDRERHTLYDFQVIDVFESIAHYIDPYGAMCMLEKMRRNWNSVRQKNIDIFSWQPVISSLISKVSQSPEITAQFREKYPDLLYLPPVYSVGDRNRRSQARSWLGGQSRKYTLVQRAFRQLGYASLEECCEQHDGFVVDDRPDALEDQGFELLERCVSELYGTFFGEMSELPQRRIICNACAAYHGMAIVIKRRRPAVNNRGLVIRYDIGELHLKKYIFSRSTFYDALATYIHEMCHIFGGDASQAFSGALTDAMEILLSNAQVVEQFRQQWCRIYNN
jgi:hypothetical protein